MILQEFSCAFVVSVNEHHELDAATSYEYGHIVYGDAHALCYLLSILDHVETLYWSCKTHCKAKCSFALCIR